LDKLNTGFSETIMRMKPGESEVLLITRKNDIMRLSINAGLFNIMGVPHKLISFQDIDKHLYKEEIESWSGLIRVLNHEIMNSITPITSLSKTMKSYFVTENKTIVPNDITTKIIDRTVEGLGIIENRGVGLINFVGNYRKLTSIPEPIKSTFNIYEHLHEIKILLDEELLAGKILFNIDVQPKRLSITADKDQIQQVLINLVKNAIQAIQNTANPTITIRGFLNEKQNIVLQVEDNGVGIPESIIKNIFTPFFTTKENGSGIGLSLSRQIMHMHNGTIKVQSGDKTVFTLQF